VHVLVSGVRHWRFLTWSFLVAAGVVVGWFVARRGLRADRTRDRLSCRVRLHTPGPRRHAGESLGPWAGASVVAGNDFGDPLRDAYDPQNHPPT